MLEWYEGVMLALLVYVCLLAWDWGVDYRKMRAQERLRAWKQRYYEDTGRPYTD